MSWASSGILYGQGSDGILRVSANGGKPEVIAAVKDGVAAHPRLLPDGQTLIFTLATASNQWDTAKTVAQNLKSGARKVLIEGGIDARYAPTGHLVYSVGGNVLAAPFDPGRLQVTAEAVPVLQGVMRYAIIGASQFDFSRTGSLVYVPGPAMVSSARNSLAIVDRKGLLESLKLPPETYDFPRVSRDGKRLAYQTDDGKVAAIWIYDLSRATAPRRLTLQGSNRYPVWSPDGERVAFQSDREGDLGIFWQRADGTGTAERLTRSEKDIGHIPDSFSPDGRYLSYTSAVGPAAAVWMLSLSDRKATHFAGDPGVRTEASVFSPDGRWVAYSLDAANGVDTVFVQAFAANGGKYQIGQGGHPCWSRDGKELYLNVGLNTAAVVNIDDKGGFAFGSPTHYATSLVGSPTGPRRSDTLPDGRSIGVVAAQPFPAGGPAKPQMRVVLNWFEDLKQHASGVK
jgi:Tol biopolymer transport system component